MTTILTPHAPRRPRPRAARIAGVAGVVALLLGTGACTEQQARDRDQKNLSEYRERAAGVFGPAPETGAPTPDQAGDDGRAGDEGRNPFAPADQGGTGGWSIVLANVPGSNRVIAEQMLATVREDVPTAFIAERGDKLFIATGRFGGPTDAAAQRELERIKQVRVRGMTPFAFAFLAPPADEPDATDSAHDLRNAKQAFGKDALYTLQVGVYGYADGRMPTPEDLALFRRTAEAAVRELRAQGELAFYYHDRTRSTVTVGVFGPEDHDPSVRPPFESPRLEQARRRHELSLLNGQGVKQTVRGPDGKRRSVLQKSFLVAVPE